MVLMEGKMNDVEWNRFVEDFRLSSAWRHSFTVENMLYFYILISERKKEIPKMKENRIKNGKRVITWVLVWMMVLATPVSAHSGRTDSRGGHRDNKNASGLGSYHYHCGGYPAHLHEDGVCPYEEVEEKEEKVCQPKLNMEKCTLTCGQSRKLKLVDVDGLTEDVKWSSSDKKVAKVNKKGKVKAIGKGTATITARIGGCDYSCTVTVAE